MTYCLIQLQVKNTLKINNMKYIINAPNSLKYITEPTPKILDIKVKEYENFFEVEKYNGYNLSSLAVRYLYEIMDSNTFKKLISDTNKILEIGKTVVKKAFCYYEEKFK